MRYQQDLQVRLRDRLKRLMIAGSTVAAHECRLAAEWINSQAPLRSIIDEAARAEPDLEVGEWLGQLAQMRGGFYWDSETEGGRATLGWAFLTCFAEADRKSTQDGVDLFRTLSQRLGGGSSFADGWLFIVEQILSPLFDYLSDHVGDQSSVLHILQRYIARVEWFDREDLYQRFEANRSTGEEIYNLDLQRFLFLEGNYVTQAKARSASGEADLIGGLDTNDPLVCDGKVFDGGSRGTASGPRQSRGLAVQNGCEWSVGVAGVVP